MITYDSPPPDRLPAILDMSLDQEVFTLLLPCGQGNNPAIPAERLKTFECDVMIGHYHPVKPHLLCQNSALNSNTERCYKHIEQQVSKSNKLLRLQWLYASVKCMNNLIVHDFNRKCSFCFFYVCPSKERHFNSFDDIID